MESWEDEYSKPCPCDKCKYIPICEVGKACKRYASYVRDKKGRIDKRNDKRPTKKWYKEVFSKQPRRDERQAIWLQEQWKGE